MRVLSAWVAAALIALPGLVPAQAPPPAAFTLQRLSPKEAQPSTTREFVHLLGRTTPGATVRVGGEPVTVYATGVFARDRVPLALGQNTVRIEATLADGQVLTGDWVIERLPPAPTPVWPIDRLFIDGSSLRPAETVRVAPGQALEVAVHATPGQRVQARLPGRAWQPLIESAASAGDYRAQLAFGGSDDVAPAPVQLRISGPALPRSAGPKVITALTPGEAGQWRADPDRLVAVGATGAELVHGLHDVRLGGPYLTELPEGTLLHAVAQQGDFVQLQLAPDTTAWAAASALQPAPAGTAAPWAAPTSLSVAGSAEGDVVIIPLAARLPYAVRAVTAADGRHQLEVDLYGAHNAATWISHRATAQVVREVSVETPASGRLRVRIAPVAARLWGWRVERTATALRIVVRPAPVIADASAPLKGLRVAIEAGHGSPANTGAVGATGAFEKDINRLTALALQAELEAAGASVVQVRVDDENPAPRERAARVTASGAQLFVSVHSNAADVSGGFLRAQGTSSYYKHDTARDLAQAVHRRVLEATGLADFGRVGNFNYTPIRLVTAMPAVLFEQAFITHPADEARLLDPALRARMAHAVRLGIEDFLRGP